MGDLVKTTDIETRKKYIPALKRNFLFKGAEDYPETLLNSAKAEWLSFEKGEVIYDYDDYKNCLAIILKGKVSVVKGKNHGSLFNTLKAGEAFGGAILFGDGPFIARVSAETASDILFIPSDVMKSLMAVSERINMNYICYLTDSLKFLNERLEIFSAGGAYERTARYLKIKCRPNGDGVPCAEGINLSSLAEYLSVGRATLYRILGGLEERGIIKKEGRKIYLIKGEEL